MLHAGLHIVENKRHVPQLAKTADKYTPEMRDKIAEDFANSLLRKTRRHDLRLGYNRDGFGVAA